MARQLGAVGYTPETVHRPKGHILELDGIRGLAILLVAVSHYAEQGAPSVFTRVLQSGWVGVDLFFALSGYLITGILLDTRESDHFLRNFYARRALRIAPVYYVALAIYFGLLIRFDPPPHAPPLWCIFYGVNVLTAMRGWPMGVGHFWSLAVEEQFYLVWPWLVRRLSARVLFQVCCGFALCSAAARFWMRWEYGAGSDTLYVLTPLHLDGLAAGAALAATLRAGWSPELVNRWCKLALALGAAMILAIAVSDKGAFQYWEWSSAILQAGGYFALAAACVGLTGVAVTSQEGHWIRRIFANGWLVRYGKYSYAIYVFHLWIHSLAKSLGINPITIPEVLAYSALQLGLALLIGVASWNLIEKHALRLKDRFSDRPNSSRKSGLEPILAKTSG